MKFKSDAQRKAVMAKLKVKRIGGYIRSVENPSGKNKAYIAQVGNLPGFTVLSWKHKPIKSGFRKDITAIKWAAKRYRYTEVRD